MFQQIQEEKELLMKEMQEEESERVMNFTVFIEQKSNLSRKIDPSFGI